MYAIYKFSWIVYGNNINLYLYKFKALRVYYMLLHVVHVKLKKKTCLFYEIFLVNGIFFQFVCGVTTLSTSKWIVKFSIE